MPCWCGPQLRVPKWMSSTFAEFRSSMRCCNHAFRSPDSRNSHGVGKERRYRIPFRRLSRSSSMRSHGSTKRKRPLRASLMRRRARMNRKRKLASEIKIIRPSNSATAAFKLRLSTSCSGDEWISEDTDQDYNTNEADNLRREYDQMRFQEKWRDDMLQPLQLQDLKISHEEMESAAESKSFLEIKRRAGSLLDQIRVLIRKFLVIADTDPGLIEVCFQIIQEEENRDEEAAECLKTNSFQSPDRPRKWKEICLADLRKVPLLRVEGTAKEDRDIDRNWLVKHMELISQRMREDLNIVKCLFDAYQSLDPDIAQFVVDTYYECITQHLQDLISNGLQHNEIIQLLSWLTEHKREMRRFNQTFVPGVCLDTAAESILPNHTWTDLEQRYMQIVRANIKQWAQGALRKEKEDWNGDKPPELDNDKCLYTEFPVHLFDLLRQNLEVARMIGPGTCKSLIAYCLDEVWIIGQHYADALKLYIPTHNKSTSPPSSPVKAHTPTNLVKSPKKSVDPRLSTASTKDQMNKPKFYVEYAVATLNNFHTIMEQCKLFKEEGAPVERINGAVLNLETIADPSIVVTSNDTNPEKDPKLAKVDEDLALSLNAMRKLARECLGKFIRDLFAEMKPYLKQVGTKKWFSMRDGRSCASVICGLITNYTIHLRKQFDMEWLDQLEQFLIVEYSKGICRKGMRITCKNGKERRDMAHLISCETDKIEETMATLRGETKDRKVETALDDIKGNSRVHISPFNMIRQMAEVIKLTDESSIVLEVSRLQRQDIIWYPTKHPIPCETHGDIENGIQRWKIYCTQSGFFFPEIWYSTYKIARSSFQLIQSLVIMYPELTRNQLEAILRMRGDLKKPTIKKILSSISSLAHDDAGSVCYCSGDSDGMAE